MGLNAWVRWQVARELPNRYHARVADGLEIVMQGMECFCLEFEWLESFWQDLKEGGAARGIGTDSYSPGIEQLPSRSQVCEVGSDQFRIDGGGGVKPYLR